tara:strand:+ start:802 stop:1035 length:234 start_codon:yes stop_codon:yes gene_type:complete
MKILVVGLLFLGGCGTVDSFKNSGDTDYVTLSHTKAGGMYQFLTGSAEACKLTKHGVTGLEYTLELSEEGCQISAAK